MDGSLTDDQVHGWLQEIADNGWISLHFQSPVLGGTAKGEISGGGYNRYLMSWHQPQNRAIWSLEDARFTGLLPNRITHFGVWSRKNQGFLRGYGELASPGTILSGRGYVLPAGELAISLG